MENMFKHGRDPFGALMNAVEGSIEFMAWHGGEEIQARPLRR